MVKLMRPLIPLILAFLMALSTSCADEQQGELEEISSDPETEAADFEPDTGLTDEEPILPIEELVEEPVPEEEPIVPLTEGESGVEGEGMASPPLPTGKRQVVYVLTDYAPIFQKPSKTSQVLDSLAKGDRVLVEFNVNETFLQINPDQWVETYRLTPSPVGRNEPSAQWSH